jgi:hypothetical protein
MPFEVEFNPEPTEEYFRELRQIIEDTIDNPRCTLTEFRLATNLRFILRKYDIQPMRMPGDACRGCGSERRLHDAVARHAYPAQECEGFREPERKET